jgi:cell division protein FtsW (lipid II flippase)
VLLLACAGLLAMYSWVSTTARASSTMARNFALGAGRHVRGGASSRPPACMRLAVPLYGMGVALLVAVLLFGITRKGATRWLNIGVVIQPSELLKIATPLMLAWPGSSAASRQIRRHAPRLSASPSRCWPCRWAADHEAARPGHRPAGAGGRAGVIFTSPACPGSWCCRRC